MADASLHAPTVGVDAGRSDKAGSRPAGRRQGCATQLLESCRASKPRLFADWSRGVSVEGFEQGRYLGVFRVAVSCPQAERELRRLGAQHERGLAGGAPALAQQQVILQ